MNKVATIDPNNSHACVINADLLGFIPTFFLNSEETDVDKAVVDGYNFFIGWTEADDMTSVVNGVFKYQGDPDYEPLAKYTSKMDTNVVYQYNHGIVAVVDSHGNLVKWTRLD